MFSREQLHSILSTLPDPAFILTRSGRYAALFGGVDNRYYHDGSGLVGLSISDVLVEEKARWFCHHIATALETKALHIVEYTLSGSDVRGLDSTGPEHVIHFEGRVQALDFLVDGEDAVVWVASNITEKNATQMRLREQSETDALTGLFNRRKLLEVLTDRHDMFVREQVPTAALMFDIDNFKGINDRLGHQMGDNVLLAISDICRQHLDRTAIFARAGGDEFVMLMPGIDCVQAEPLAKLLASRIGSGIFEKLALQASISGGLSEFCASDQTSNDILKRADDGLYQSKRNGRDRISSIRPSIAPPLNKARV